jgi:hypothetical protein
MYRWDFAWFAVRRRIQYNVGEAGREEGGTRALRDSSSRF